MDFYIRKSVRVGILRFTLSKSGIAVSDDVTGFRIGSPPSVTCVRLGQGAVHYRQHLFGEPETEGAPASVRTDAGDLLTEVRAKSRSFSWFYLALVVWAILTLAGLLILGAPGLVLIVLLSPAVLYPVYVYDQQLRSVVVMYDLEADAEEAFRRIYGALVLLRRGGSVWSVTTYDATEDYKQNVGASAVLNRKLVTIADDPPKFVTTNVSVPSLQLHHDKLFFFPDRVFITNAEGVRAVGYSELHPIAQVKRFIEDGPVPRDATRVGTTWKYVNKDGGQDERFADNRALPILNYQDVVFAPEIALHAYLQVSNSAGANPLVKALDAMASFHPDSAPSDDPPAIGSTDSETL